MAKTKKASKIKRVEQPVESLPEEMEDNELEQYILTLSPQEVIEFQTKLVSLSEEDARNLITLTLETFKKQKPLKAEVSTLSPKDTSSKVSSEEVKLFADTIVPAASNLQEIDVLINIRNYLWMQINNRGISQSQAHSLSRNLPKFDLYILDKILNLNIDFFKNLKNS